MSQRALAFQHACRARLLPQIPIAPVPSIATKLLSRSYAASSAPGSSSPPKPSPRHHGRAITVASDDGRYNWSELSTTEKAARTTQQSFNFLIVVAGAIGTVAVGYLLYAELFAADSKTRQFNHAVDRIKGDARCRELLGPSNKIIAYGEPTSNKWARARPLAYTSEVDKFGNTHFRMHFNMEGPDNRGTVMVHMTKGKNDKELAYRLLSLNIPGHEIVYLENADGKSPKKALGRMFGVNWGR